MEIEKQVCSLELAKQLKELGVKQESLWYWEQYAMYSSLEMNVEFRDKLWHKSCFENLSRIGAQTDSYSAFTVAELGEMIPREFQWHSYKFILNGKESWDCISSLPNLKLPEGDSCGDSLPDCFADTEADARAKMLIYLIENKLIAL